jgi:hypothetical protein
VSITGETPSLAGWTFVAVLEPLTTEDGQTENLVQCLPGETCPVEFRSAIGRCDHCKMTRRRNQTFVVRNVSGEYKCVGRQCVKDFLGYNGDPHKFASWAESLAELSSMCGSAEDEEWMGGGGRIADAWDLPRFLTLVACRVRLFGWVSRSTARDSYEKQATADVVLEMLTPPNLYNRDKHNKLVAAHTITDADSVVLWQGSKTEAQAFSVDVGVVTSPAIGTQVSCRPYGIITYGSDGWQNSYRFDIGQGTRLTGVGNYCSVLVGMDAPGFGLPSGQMTLGAGLGTFAATSLAPVTLTSYVEGIRVVPDLNNNVDVVMPVKAKLLLPPQCSDVNTLTQIDFYDIAGNLLYSLQFLSGTIVSPIPLSNDFAYVKVTRLSTSSGPVYATYRLIWQLAL